MFLIFTLLMLVLFSWAVGKLIDLVTGIRH